MTQTYGDAVTAPFWAGASEGRLLLQRCDSCGAHRFYPRPFCLSCDDDRSTWTAVSGAGVVYSKTEVQVKVLPGLAPPYTVAVVELAEGPRMTALIVGADGEPGPGCEIGDAVDVAWRPREDAPPLPVFRRRP
ncbi:Zn-ribbon domain-containing OB-fold protein [Rhizohabitans arisaemae]|uniref:Zn-ribbon domain-containing OB-fold protein n=1 Tax=Rhizohabitans arisaemae TaxID=2720610 RepID=UPI0024B194E4|nr:OB-fold domain-containing protein [Rhizohabitans arisaemae]